jgi:hypothetical protein
MMMALVSFIREKKDQRAFWARAGAYLVIGLDLPVE